MVSACSGSVSMSCFPLHAFLFLTPLFKSRLFFTHLCEKVLFLSKLASKFLFFISASSLCFNHRVLFSLCSKFAVGNLGQLQRDVEHTKKEICEVNKDKLRPQCVTIHIHFYSTSNKNVFVLLNIEDRRSMPTCFITRVLLLKCNIKQWSLPSCLLATLHENKKSGIVYLWDSQYDNPCLKLRLKIKPKSLNNGNSLSVYQSETWPWKSFSD